MPTAHYMMGGILTNENAQTTIEQLYAVGEVAVMVFMLTVWPLTLF